MLAEALTRPSTRDDFGRYRIRHLTCDGGRVIVEDDEYPSWYGAPALKFECLKCKLRFPARYLDRIGAQGIADRFLTEIPPRDLCEALVWVIDPVTKKQFASCRPIAEVLEKGWERVKL